MPCLAILHWRNSGNPRFCPSAHSSRGSHPQAAEVSAQFERWFLYDLCQTRIRIHSNIMSIIYQLLFFFEMHLYAWNASIYAIYIIHPNGTRSLQRSSGLDSGGLPYHPNVITGAPQRLLRLFRKFAMLKELRKCLGSRHVRFSAEGNHWGPMSMRLPWAPKTYILRGFLW